MSEFSESYHLRSNDAQEAVEILRRAGERGYVFPASAGWVAFVSEGNLFEPNPAIVKANPGILVHYVNQEDYCCWFAIFERSEMKCGYRCDWSEGLEVDDSAYSRAALSKILSSDKEDEVDAFEETLQPSDQDEIFETNPAREFAKLMGLAHFDYVSYDSLAEGMKRNAKAVQGVIEVK